MITLGITFTQEHLQIAIVSKKKSKISIQELSKIVNSPDSIRQLYSCIQEKYKKNFTVATCLTAKDVLFRRVHLPLKDKRKILASLPFLIESLIIIPDHPIISISIDSVLNKKSSIGVFITSQTLFFKHIEFLESKGIDTNYVGSAISNLFRFITWALPQQRNGIVIHISSQEMTCLFYQDNLLQSAQTFSIKSHNIKKNLKKYQVFLSQKGWDINFPYVLIEEIPSESARIAKEVFGTNQVFLEDPSLQEYALVIGAALESLVENGKQIHFSQKEFITKKTQAHFLRKIYCYLIGCAAFTLLSFIAVQSHLNKKQTALFTYMSSNLPKKLQRTHPKSIQEWQDSLLSWEKTTQRKKISFPMLPTVPKVSDILAWISSHPAFINAQGKLKEGIDISSIHYKMLNYPTIDKENAPYEAQVEVTFTASTPRLAREFHEALLKNNRMINIKKPVHWQAQGNKYRASFILKPLS